MSGNALVSIIIPAYNTAPYIHRAIESALGQTYANVELIVIDDGSTDDTLRVSTSYAERDERLRVYHQENAGVSAARNHGMREANGDYFMFLDSDDWLEDNALEILLGVQMKYPGKLAAANFYDVQYDKNGGFTRTAAHTDNPESIHIGSVSEAVSFWWEAHLQYIHAKIFSSSLIASNGLRFREDIHYGEDAVFVFEYIHEAGGAEYINRQVANYFHWPDSATGKPYEQRKRYKDYRQIMLDHPANTPEVREKLRSFQTKTTIQYLLRALESRVDAHEVKYLQERTRIYFREYMSHSTMPARAKISLLCKTYLPVCVIRGIMKFKSTVKRVLHIFRRKN